MLRKILILIFLSVTLNIYCQQPTDFFYADSITYSYYSAEKWKDLIREGHSAIRNGFDYYYMRMRIGIAYYSRKNFAMAEVNFRKALSFNGNDQTAIEYLFYCYFLSGRTNQARAMLADLYPQNRERIVKECKLKKNNLTIESFFSDASTGGIVENPGSYFSEPEPGSQIVTKYFINNALYATHYIGNKASYFHAFTSLIKENFLFYFDGTNTHSMDPQRLVQSQYYGSFSLNSSSGWSLSPAFHFLRTTYPVFVETSYGMNSQLSKFVVGSNSIFTGISLSKNMGFISFNAEAAYTNLNNLGRMQETFGILIYPAGNASVYVGGKISTTQKMIINSSAVSFAGGITAGFSIAGKVWFEFNGLAGSLNNYADGNGLYIYNSADLLKNKFTGRIIIPFPKAGLTVFTGGGISSYSSEFISTGGTISENGNKLDYNSFNFTGGISWNF